MITGRDAEPRGRGRRRAGRERRQCRVRSVRAGVDRGGAGGARLGRPPRARRARPRPQQRRRLRRGEGDPLGHPEARRLHGDGPRAAGAAHARRVDRDLRGPREAEAVSGLDDDHDDQSRRGRTGPDDGRGAASDPRQRAASRDRGRQPVLGAEDRGARGDACQDPHRTPGRDARRHRRGRVPAGESVHARQPRSGSTEAGRSHDRTDDGGRRRRRSDGGRHGGDASARRRSRPRLEPDGRGRPRGGRPNRRLGLGDDRRRDRRRGCRDLEPGRRRRGDRDVRRAGRRRRRGAGGSGRAGDEHDRAAHRASDRTADRSARRDAAGRPGLRQRLDGREGRAHDHGRRRPHDAGSRAARARRAGHEGLPRRRARRGSHDEARGEFA